MEGQPGIFSGLALWAGEHEIWEMPGIGSRYVGEENILVQFSGFPGSEIRCSWSILWF
jgi:hypothetical protein